MNEINLDYLNACRLLIPGTETINVILAGCGGTGSWLAPSIVRVARLVKEKFAKTVDVYFVDPDHVEAKNCYRQNFSEAEIGRNKADALAWRYGLAWGIEVTAIAAPIESCKLNFLGGNLTILIGCVDNAAGRRSIQEIAKNNAAWWLDCGNNQASGQILLGSGMKRPDNPLLLPGFCSWLPLPSELHPELFKDAQENEIQEENLSCAEMAMRDSQGMAINQRIAAEAADYLVRMLLTKDLCKYATYIDLASGSARSKYIRPESTLLQRSPNAED